MNIEQASDKLNNITLKLSSVYLDVVSITNELYESSIELAKNYMGSEIDDPDLLKAVNFIHSMKIKVSAVESKIKELLHETE